MNGREVVIETEAERRIAAEPVAIVIAAKTGAKSANVRKTGAKRESASAA